jgi:hypothetical protein
MKKAKQWAKPEVDTMKRKKTKKAADASADRRYGLGPLAPPAPPYIPDFV